MNGYKIPNRIAHYLQYKLVHWDWLWKPLTPRDPSTIGPFILKHKPVEKFMMFLQWVQEKYYANK